MDGEHPLIVLGRVEGKVDLILNKLASHDNRISSVETKVYWASGVGAVLSVIAAKLGWPFIFGA